MDNWRIRLAVAKSDMSMTEIAAKSGISRTSLDSLLNDGKDCRISTFEAVCRTLGLNAGDLFSGEAAPDYIPAKMRHRTGPKPIEPQTDVKVLRAIESLINSQNMLVRRISKLLGDGED